METIKASLIGGVAPDNSVVTKVDCRVSSVVHNAGDTWTASCTLTYSDGSVWAGYANLVPAENKVTWQPVTQLQ